MSPSTTSRPARQVVLYLHLSETALAGHDRTARLDHANTLIATSQVRAWCGSPDTTKITIKPTTSTG